MDATNTNNSTSRTSNDVNNISSNSKNRFPILQLFKVVWLLYIFVLINKLFPSEYGKKVTEWVDEFYNKKNKTPNTPSSDPTDDQQKLAKPKRMLRKPLQTIQEENEEADINLNPTQEERGNEPNTHSVITTGEHHLQDLAINDLQTTDEEDKATDTALQPTQEPVYKLPPQRALLETINEEEEETESVHNTDQQQSANVNKSKDTEQLSTTQIDKPKTELDIKRMESWKPFNDILNSSAWNAINSAAITNHEENNPIIINDDLDRQIEQLHQDILKSMDDSEEIYSSILEYANMDESKQVLQQHFSNIRNTSPSMSILTSSLPLDSHRLEWTEKQQLSMFARSLDKRRSIKSKNHLVDTLVKHAPDRFEATTKQEIAIQLQKITNAINMQATLLASIRVYQQYSNDIRELQKRLNNIEAPNKEESVKALEDPVGYKQYVGRHAVSWVKYFTQTGVQEQIALEDTLRQGFLLNLQELYNSIYETKNHTFSSTLPRTTERTDAMLAKFSGSSILSIIRNNAAHRMSLENVAQIAQLFFSNDPEFHTKKLAYLSNIIDILDLESYDDDHFIIKSVNRKLADGFISFVLAPLLGLNMSQTQRNTYDEMITEISDMIHRDYMIMNEENLAEIRRLKNNKQAP